MIQKSELKQVPVEQRVPGRLYGVSDTLDGELLHFTIHKNKNEGYWAKYWANWQYWFELPESMLPVREVIPDQIILDLNEWSYSYSDSVILLHRKKIRPEITIQSGSKSKQIEQLEKILAELKQS